MNMVERVARAIFAANPKPVLNDFDSYRRGKGSYREKLFNEARAAIEAMREPTTDMVRGLLAHRGYDPDAKESTLDRLGQIDIATMGAFTRAYSAMIDAALASEKDPA